jgi:uncharacterized protein YkwD
MRKFVLVAVIASLLLLVVPPVASAITLTKAEKQLLTLINKKRAARDLPALHVNAKLQRAARAHSAEMVAKDYFSHDSANGESFSKRLIRFGYKQAGCTSWRAGENIAWGAGLLGTPQAIFKAWMKSSAHRRIMLSKSFRDVGVGRAKGEFKGTDGAFLFTLDVGKRTF